MVTEGLMRWDTQPARLRLVSFIEGLSYVLLLFVAMPLKYLADMPMAVRIVGMAHGVLFIALAWLAFREMQDRGHPLSWGARIAVAAIIPFGTFVLDRRLKEEDDAFRARASA